MEMTSRSSNSFKQVQCTLYDVFTNDTRPTLVVDLENVSHSRGVPLELANDAFTEQFGVLLRFIISGQVLEPDFIDWIKSPQPPTDEYILGDLSWKYFILAQRWKIVNVVAALRPSRHSSISSIPPLKSLSQAAQSIGVASDSPPVGTMDVPVSTDSEPKVGSTLTVALPSGLVSLGSASTALEGLHRSVEMLDVGFFEYDTEGILIFANKSWYALSGHPTHPGAHTEKKFLELCHPDDVQKVANAWGQLLAGKNTTFEMRWKHQASASAKLLGAQWVQAACIPLRDADGKITSITGCTTDINNQKLSEQIALSRAEALERARTFEERFVRFAQVAPIVIFSFDANRKMKYCNDRWFEATSTAKKRFEDIDVGEGFVEEDVAKLFARINDAIKDKEVHTIEMRTNKIWHAADGRRAQAWVLASIFAEFTKEGVFQGCTGTLIDISEFKNAEALQRIRLDEALEAKRQQENFIDMTSHEMRNPLSAIVQCADSAFASVNEMTTLVKSIRTDQVRASTRTRILEEAEIGFDSLQTIMSCCAHQKCIIDDVLTMSKLDSKLLAVSPIKVQPARIMQEVTKMFEMDAQKADVEITTEVDRTFRSLDIQWLMMDPSRVKQILINLISNAIKFTRTETTRKVVLRMCASVNQPNSSGTVRYAPASRSPPDDLLNENEWGSGEIVYLQFSLQDTGRGLSPEELERLFHRFMQASPKTHVHYGGSGLGLFITRQLTELHGGEIGVASEVQKGSTFAFYIRTRRTSPPTILSPNPAPLFLSAPPEQQNIDSNTKDSPNIMATSHSPLVHPSAPITAPPDWHPNILIVEDNMVNQRVLSTQLKRLGCRISVAGHGLEALGYLRTTQVWHQSYEADHALNTIYSVHQYTSSLPPGPLPTSPTLQPLDIILMDIEMPIMGGLACTRAIRELEAKAIIRRPQPMEPGYRLHQHHQLPVISISANARAEQSNEQREAGVDDIIVKPFRIPQLMDKIYRLVGRQA